ncbi:MAG TPA: DUF1294 domain-containing protein [Tepidisphaeraceae bacterium]|nr:DUF1294 domain-containing protein [Tepidisphaeraceae bacterium]
MLAVVLILPWPILLYLAMSILTFSLYLMDKNKAIKGQWRIRENTLHLFELLGGWPGALVAQQLIHHKNRKFSYLLVFWAILIAHLCFWGWWFGLFRW